jgi:RHS repeat-associated protein
VRIKIDHTAGTGTSAVRLTWQHATAVPTAVTVPAGTGTAPVGIKPGFWYATKTITDDAGTGVPASMTTETRFDEGVDPVYGLATSTTVDPAGLALKTATAYEAPAAASLLRRTRRTLPAYAAAPSDANSSTYTYYPLLGTESTATNPCVAGSLSVFQGGLAKTATTPTPAAGAAVTTETRYDILGRPVATRYNTDTTWACTLYDDRGRVKTTTYPAFGAAAGDTITRTYRVGGDPRVTTIANAVGTITTKVDALGRTISTTDVWNQTTTTSYDQAGRATQTSGPGGVIARIYDTASRVTAINLDGQRIANLTYTPDTALLDPGVLDTISYPSGAGNAGNGTSLAPIVRDSLGRTTTLEWRQPGGTLLTRDVVTRAQSGRVLTTTIDTATTPTWRYTYDSAGRLATAAGSGHDYRYGYATATGCTGVTGAQPAAGKNTNRSDLIDNGVTVAGYCYDQADRLLAVTTSTTPPPPATGLVRTAKGSATKNNGTSPSGTMTVAGVTSTAGALLVVAAGATATANCGLSITDTAGLTWTEVTREQTGAKFATGSLFYAVANGTTTAVTLTCTTSGVFTAAMSVWAYSGHNGIGAVGVNGGDDIVEQVDLNAAPAASSEVLSMQVSSEYSNLTVTPNTPFTELYEADVDHTTGDGSNFSTVGVGMELSLAAATNRTTTPTTWAMVTNNNEYSSAFTTIEVKAAAPPPSGLVRTAKGSATKNNGASPSGTMTVAGVTSTAGELLVVAAGATATANCGLSITDTAGLTWTEVTREQSGAKFATGSLFYAVANGTTTSITVTCTTTGVFTAAMSVWAYSGHNGIGAVGVNGGDDIVEQVDLNAVPAASSEVLSMQVSSEYSNLTVTPNTPFTELFEADVDHTTGDGSNFSTVGVGMELSLAAATNRTTTPTSWAMVTNNNEYSSAFTTIEVKAAAGGGGGGAPPVVTTVGYDAHGNTTTMGAETYGYDYLNRHLSTVAGASTVSYTRDALNRIVARVAPTGTTRYAYSDGADSAALVLNTTNTLVQATIGLPGGVTLTRVRNGGAWDATQAVWSYPNIHGDHQATANQSGVKTAGPVVYDPYGGTITGVVPDNSTGNMDYGWLGQHQRPQEHEPGLQPVIEMGARPYHNTLGRFLTIDPVPGASCNDYDYVCGDPVNAFDLAGEAPCRSPSQCLSALLKGLKNLQRAIERTPILGPAWRVFAPVRKAHAVISWTKRALLVSKFVYNHSPLNNEGAPPSYCRNGQLDRDQADAMGFHHVDHC